MTKEKQIIEIKECIDAVYGADCAYFGVDGFAVATKIYNAGYRKHTDVFLLKENGEITPLFSKQSEGEWLLKQNGKGVCSNCHRQDSIDELANFCRYCGAKMRKEDEGK